ncbi:hypothetical protein, partial [Sulfuricurvum sp. MLSB]|uniref:hypothetical protein n=1 Tax=Sulfuricurvum sp. MLSB TaxID=1537917 RepID=UPI0025EBD638
ELDKEIKKLRDEQVGGDEAVNANYNAKINAKELEISNLKLKLTQEHQALVTKLTDNSIENEIDEKRKSIARQRDERNRINDLI